VDIPFDPQDRLADPEGVDELRVRRIGPRADVELERLRTALADSTRRIAELESVLSDTRTRLAERVQEATSLAAHRALAGQLEAELARERQARRAAEDLLAGERERFARVLADSQLELRDELRRARTEGGARVEAAHAEAGRLREELAAAAAELDRAAAESRAASLERAALEQELRAAQAALAERADADELRAELAARTAAEARAVAELTGTHPDPDRLPPVRALAPDVPRADHPALGNVPDRGAVPDAVIADLARAAARLRELAEAPGVRPAGEAATDGTAGEAVVEPEAAVVESEAVVAEEAVGEPGAAAVPEAVVEPQAVVEPEVAALEEGEAERPAPEAAAGVAAAPVGPPAEPEPLRVLPAPVPARPTSVRWLAPAFAELAREDAGMAARLLLDFLPVQGLSARRALTYEVAPEHGGRHLVHVERGAARVERDVAWGLPAPVRVAGPVGVLAALVAGARTRPHGALVLGRKGRLRRLLRDARTPVGLPELARAGVRPDPAGLLALLAASVRPDRTRGTSAVVTYLLGEAPRAAVVVADGAPLVVLADPGGIAATAEVHTTPDALLEVLAGTAEARVRGDLEAVQKLHRWLRAVQGLDG
jgi:hypothetical protein